ncbi:MAG: hypothetical protein V1835_00895 [Candidatus Micrarchaeota archaeon]
MLMKHLAILFALISILPFSNAIVCEDSIRYSDCREMQEKIRLGIFQDAEPGSPAQESPIEVPKANFETESPPFIFSMYLDTQRHNSLGEYKDRLGAVFGNGDKLFFAFKMQAAMQDDELRIYLEKQDEVGSTQFLCVYKFKDDNNIVFPLKFSCDVLPQLALSGKYKVLALLYSSEGDVKLTRYWGKGDETYLISLNPLAPAPQASKVQTSFGGAKYLVTVESKYEPRPLGDSVGKVDEESAQKWRLLQTASAGPVSLKPPSMAEPLKELDKGLRGGWKGTETYAFTDTVPGVIGELPRNGAVQEAIKKTKGTLDPNALATLVREIFPPTAENAEPLKPQNIVGKPETQKITLEIVDIKNSPLCSVSLPAGALEQARTSGCGKPEESANCITPTGEGLTISYCGASADATFVKIEPAYFEIPIDETKPLAGPVPGKGPLAIKEVGPNVAPKVKASDRPLEGRELVFNSLENTITLTSMRGGNLLFKQTYLAANQLPSNYGGSKECFSIKEIGSSVQIHYNMLCQVCGHVADLVVSSTSTGKPEKYPLSASCHADVLMLTDGDMLIAPKEIQEQISESPWYKKVMGKNADVIFDAAKSRMMYYAEVLGYIERAKKSGYSVRYVELEASAKGLGTASTPDALNKWGGSLNNVEYYILKTKSLRQIIQPDTLLVLGAQRIIPSKTYGQDGGAYKAIITSIQPYGTPLNNPLHSENPDIAVARIPGLEIVGITAMLRSLNSVPASVEATPKVINPLKATLPGALEGRRRIVQFYLNQDCKNALDCLDSPPFCTEEDAGLGCRKDRMLDAVHTPPSFSAGAWDICKLIGRAEFQGIF